jgi:hypothetical protein
MTPIEATETTLPELPTLSWSAVIAGAVTSAALTLLLAALGVGLGLSAISPWAGEGVSATTFKIGTGIYLVAVAMLAGTVGGYLAGRLRTKWFGVNENEIYFRDTAHGLAVWAVATVLAAATLGAATTHILGGLAGSTVTAAAAAAPVTNPTDIYVDSLLRTDPASSTPGVGDNGQATRGEMGRLLLPILQKGSAISPTDQTYVAKVVSARTGLPQAEAEKRVSDVITQIKKAADDARKAARSLALWFVASMLAGAVASMLGATEGGLLRDSRWYEPGWRATITRHH